MLAAARQPIWLLGLGCDIGGFVLEAFAFSNAPATLVAPLMAADLVVFVVLARIVFHARLDAWSWSGAALAGLGLAVLALSFAGGSNLGETASARQLAVFLGAVVVVAGLAALFGDRAVAALHNRLAAVIFSAASGGCYSIATIATRQVGREFSIDEPLQLLTTFTPYVLAVCSLLGVALTQRGLQLWPVLSFPVVSAVSAFVPVVLGAAVLGEDVPTGAARLAFVAALALLAAGVCLLGRAREAADHP
jgi:drug/metabolite transporter (DMT)-like permease